MIGRHVKTEARGSCEQSFSTASNLGNQILRMGEDRVGAVDTGATANCVRFRWLGNRDMLSETHGSDRVSTYPGRARFKLGDGRLG